MLDSWQHCKSYKINILKHIEEADDYVKPSRTSKHFKKRLKQWTSAANIRIDRQSDKKNKDCNKSETQDHDNILTEFWNNRNMIRFKLLDNEKVKSENLDSDRYLKMKRKEYFSSLHDEDSCYSNAELI